MVVSAGENDSYPEISAGSMFEEARSMMNRRDDIQVVLQSVANEIFSVVSPTTAGRGKISVVLDDLVDRACTDGQSVILLPPTFCGLDVRATPPLALGLLAHEMGHCLQPMPAMFEVEQHIGAPLWLTNVLLDIQGETHIARLFPDLAGPLAHVRMVVKTMHQYQHLQALVAATSFTEASSLACLFCRFIQPAEPFGLGWYAQTAGILNRQTLARLKQHPWWETLDQFLQGIWQSRITAANDLPALLAQLMASFPDLKHCPTSMSPYEHCQAPQPSIVAAPLTAVGL
jgi:hypothetical protein